jgi:DedD protein
MPQPVTDDELQLRKRARRRLVGAIVLVLLTVVFLPMALDNEPKPLSKNVDIQVPALDSAENKFPGGQPAPETPPLTPAEPRTIELPPEPKVEPPVVSAESIKPAPLPEPEKKPEAPKPPEPVKKAEPAKKPESAKKAETAKKPEPAKPQPKETKHEVAKTSSMAPIEAQGYVVQLGAFSTSANAKQLYEKVRAARLPAYMEPVPAGGGAKTRVRAGPFPTEDAADKARQKLLQSGLAKGNLKIVKQGE